MNRDDARSCAAAAALVIVVGFIYPHLPGQIVSLPDRESGLPGAAAVIFPSEAAARDACGAQAVVFADPKAHAFYRKANTRFGRWDGRAFPDRGFGCADDLVADGLGPA